MTGTGFLLFAIVLAAAAVDKHSGGRFFSDGARVLMGFVSIGAYMAMTYGIASWLWAVMP